MKKLVVLLLFMCGVTAFAQRDITPKALAPILVGPYDGKSVEDDNIVWTWFMQPTASNGDAIICDLKVVEVLDGQSPEEALRNNQLLILKEDLRSSAWQTNFATKNFIPGHKYAWRVIAKTLDVNGKEEVVSQSEIWTYTYVGPDVAEEPQPEIVETSPTSSIGFFGKAKLTMEHNGNTFLSDPRLRNLARLQIAPTLKLYDVPFGLNLLLTTEENTRESDVSRGAFGTGNSAKGLNMILQQNLEDVIGTLEAQRDSAEIDSLRQLSFADSLSFENRLQALYQLRDVDATEKLETLKQFGLVTAEQEAMAMFPAYGVGKAVPQFSSMLFNNVTINGAYVEYNPSQLYTAGMIGKVAREINVSDIPFEAQQRDSALLTNVSLFKNVYSARIGYGRKNGNRIIFSAVHSDDDDQSMLIQNVVRTIKVDSTVVVPVLGFDGKPIVDADDSTKVLSRDSTFTLVRRGDFAPISRQINTVLGLDAAYSDESGLSFQGEFNLSNFTDIDNKLWSKRDILFGIRSAELLTSKDSNEHEVQDFSFAVTGGYLFNNNSSEIRFGSRYVGGGYRSVGVAALRTDILRYDGLFRQNLFDNQLRGIVKVSRENAGYKVDKNNESVINSYSLLLDASFVNLPVLSIAVSQNTQELLQQKSSENKTAITNGITNATVSSSYGFRAIGLRFFTNVSAVHQNGTTKRNDSIIVNSSGNFSSLIVSLSERFSWNEQASIGVSITNTTSVTHVDSEEPEEVREESSSLRAAISFLYSVKDNLDFSAGVTHEKGLYNGKENILTGVFVNSQLAISEFVTVNCTVEHRNPFGDNKSLLTSGQGLMAKLVTNVQW